MIKPRAKHSVRSVSLGVGCYTYDNGGNITDKTTYTLTSDGSLYKLASRVTYGYGNSNWKDQLTSYNGTAITYDASGNPLKWRNASAMNWTGRQLDFMTLTDGTSVSFQYNSDGLRVSKTVGSETVKYRWDGTTLLAEEHSTYTLTFLYDGGTLIGFNYGGNNYYYGIDNLGVIHYVYNEAGTVVVTYTYDAWGNTISASGNSTLININPICYKSYYHDSETGFFYLQSRYYDAVVGRFVNADDAEYIIEAKVYQLVRNLYCYCYNNSQNMEDVYGNEADYINDQNDEAYCNLKFGIWGTIGANGCGVVAAYNVLHSYSSSIKFDSLRKHFSYSSLYNMIGKIGVSPDSLVNYLKTKFWSVYTAGAITTWWGIKSELSKAVIVLYKGKGWDSPWHYIAGISTGKFRSGGDFVFYNCTLLPNNYTTDPKYRYTRILKSYSIVECIKILKSKGCTPIYFIGVSGKRGKW